MDKKELEKWLKATVNNLFMDFLYYNRKNDPIMNVEKVRKLMDDNVLSKEMMTKVFIEQIEKEY